MSELQTARPRLVEQPDETNKRKFIARLRNAGWSRKDARAQWREHEERLRGKAG